MLLRFSRSTRPPAGGGCAAQRNAGRLACSFRNSKSLSRWGGGGLGCLGLHRTLLPPPPRWPPFVAVVASNAVWPPPQFAGMQVRRRRKDARSAA